LELLINLFVYSFIRSTQFIYSPNEAMRSSKYAIK